MEYFKIDSLVYIKYKKSANIIQQIQDEWTVCIIQYILYRSHCRRMILK